VRITTNGQYYTGGHKKLFLYPRLTQARADELNAEYEQLVAQREGTFKNFKLLYFDPDLEPMIGKYMALGGDRERIDCIEPCDGFHPSQPLHELYAGAMNEGPVASSFQKETHRIYSQIWYDLDEGYYKVTMRSNPRCDLGLAGEGPPGCARAGQPVQRRDREALRSAGRLLAVHTECVPRYATV
jgi:hypothetical protein